MDPDVELVKDDNYSKKVDTVQYQSMVGSLDTAHAVGIVSEPTQAHLTAVKRMYQYLKGTLDIRSNTVQANKWHFNGLFLCKLGQMI